MMHTIQGEDVVGLGHFGLASFNRIELPHAEHAWQTSFGEMT